MIQKSDLNTSVTEIRGCGLGVLGWKGLRQTGLGSTVHFKQVWGKGLWFKAWGSRFGVSGVQV